MGRPPWVISTRCERAVRAPRRVRTVRSTSSKVPTPRKWQLKLAGRANGLAAPAARSATDAT